MTRKACSVISKFLFKTIFSPPPSSSNKKKEKERRDPIMSRQNPARRRQVMDSDEEMGPKSVSSGDSEAVRVSLSSISRLSVLLTL